MKNRIVAQLTKPGYTIVIRGFDEDGEVFDVIKYHGSLVLDSFGIMRKELNGRIENWKIQENFKGGLLVNMI